MEMLQNMEINEININMDVESIPVLLPVSIITCIFTCIFAYIINITN